MNIIKPTRVLVLCMLTLLACEKKEPVKENETAVKEAVVECPSSFTQPKIAKGKGSIKSLPISVKEAGEKIVDLLMHPPLEGMARNIALGGHFYAKTFKINSADTSAAVILWSCYNPAREFNLPVLFVAVEQVPRFDPNQPPTRPAAVTLDVPINSVRYEESGNSQSHAEAFIRKYVVVPNPNPPGRTITKDVAERFIQKFESMMTTLEQLGGEDYHTHPFAIFRNNQYYKDFEGRPHKFVKYCFTLYWDEEHQPNYFRPVLGITDENGKLVESTNAAGDDVTMLQKSWPPPPNQ